MNIQLNASKRLAATEVTAASGQEWFNSLSKKQQADYLKLHPKSKFGKSSTPATNDTNDNASRKKALNDIKAKAKEAGIKISNLKGKTAHELENNHDVFLHGDISSAAKFLSSQGLKKVGESVNPHSKTKEIHFTKDGKDYLLEEGEDEHKGKNLLSIHNK